MKKLLLLLLLLPMTVLAGQVNVEWVAPTEREDNTPLPQSEIGSFRVYDLNSGNLLKESTDNLVTNAILDLPNGNSYSLVMTTVDTAGRESVYSPNPVNVSLDHTPPKSPTGVTVTVLP